MLDGVDVDGDVTDVMVEDDVVEETGITSDPLVLVFDEESDVNGAVPLFSVLDVAAVCGIDKLRVLVETVGNVVSTGPGYVKVRNSVEVPLTGDSFGG